MEWGFESMKIELNHNARQFLANLSRMGAQHAYGTETERDARILGKAGLADCDNFGVWSITPKGAVFLLESVTKSAVSLSFTGTVWRVSVAGNPVFQSKDKASAESMLPVYREIAGETRT